MADHSDLSSSLTSDFYHLSARSDTAMERECSTSGSISVSLLSRLKARNPFEFACKRRVDTNPPPKGKKRSVGCGTVGPKSVSAYKSIQGNTLLSRTSNSFAEHAVRSCLL